MGEPAGCDAGAYRTDSFGKNAHQGVIVGGRRLMGMPFLVKPLHVVGEVHK